MATRLDVSEKPTEATVQATVPSCSVRLKGGMAGGRRDKCRKAEAQRFKLSMFIFTAQHGEMLRI